MSSIKSLTSFRLDLPPSCIEFFPLNPQYAVIGTYNLEKADDDDGEEEAAGSAPHDGQHVDGSKKSQQRNGSLVLVRVLGDHVDIIQSYPTPSAILDIHFLTQVPSSNFGVATSTGAFALYELTSWKRNPEISHIKTIQYFPENVLITAFTWHPESYMVGMTLSNHQVHLGLIDTAETDDNDNNTNDTASSPPPPTMEITRHDLEAWTLAFLPDASGLLSGADDSTLRFASLADTPHAPSSPWTDRKTHSAGVTAILPVHMDDAGTLVVTGSYDDQIRLLHVANAGGGGGGGGGGRRNVLAEAHLGGGVWRVKLLDRTPKLPAHHGVAKWRAEPPPETMVLLVSCMHAGARIVRLAKTKTKTKEEEEEEEEEGLWAFEVLAKFEEHESMNYGSDCQPGELNGAGERTFITTSFYDRRLCLWRY